MYCVICCFYTALSNTEGDPSTADRDSCLLVRLARQDHVLSNGRTFDERMHLNNTTACIEAVAFPLQQAHSKGMVTRHVPNHTDLEVEHNPYIHVLTT